MAFYIANLSSTPESCWQYIYIYTHMYIYIFYNIELLWLHIANLFYIVHTVTMIVDSQFIVDNRVTMVLDGARRSSCIGGWLTASWPGIARLRWHILRRLPELITCINPSARRAVRIPDCVSDMVCGSYTACLANLDPLGWTRFPLILARRSPVVHCRISLPAGCK